LGRYAVHVHVYDYDEMLFFRLVVIWAIEVYDHLISPHSHESYIFLEFFDPLESQMLRFSGLSLISYKDHGFSRIVSSIEGGFYTTSRPLTTGACHAA
jgi:hypothetical protein